MPEVNQKTHVWDSLNEGTEKLEGSLAKLISRTGEAAIAHKGLSEAFRSEVVTEAQALEECGRAIGRLCNEYVTALTAFNNAALPLEALKALDEAETIWKTESATIAKYDAEGQEIEMLRNCRSQTRHVIEDRLEESARVCKAKPTPENVALTMACLGTLDSVLNDLGHPLTSPERKRLASIAAGFR